MSDRIACMVCRSESYGDGSTKLVCPTCYRAARTWTDTKPTAPGWYWYRWNHGTARVRHVSHAKGDEQLWVCDDQARLSPLNDGMLSQWAGPINPPEEPS